VSTGVDVAKSCKALDCGNMPVSMPRPRFFRRYGDCLIWIEQRATCWHGAVYRERRPFGPWDLFISTSEKGCKDAAIITVENEYRDRNEPVPKLVGDWSDDSDRPEEEWTRQLAAKDFPGYRDCPRKPQSHSKEE
jgi:hypothetical protein